MKLHLGCGEKHINGMINCDCRKTSATDMVMDCSNISKFDDNSISLIFSNAFFEHLFKNQQLPLLKDCYRILEKEGLLIILGIPNFEIIARQYINKGKGIIGSRFDLYNVYRYTHGNPELALDSWLGQLHKSLFDKEYLRSLLISSNFKYFYLFNYCYPMECIPLNLGVVAIKEHNEKKTINLSDILSEFSMYIKDLKEIQRNENLIILDNINLSQ